ncbi:MAG: hypothetical protein JWM80_925 [Cyanobacteria bacterium RYN_339]|nr:hypothetical protein [Cyanobacteria bacterium RYN_339]
MALEQTPAFMAFDAFRALPEETRAELIDGVFTSSPAPTWRHQRLQARLLSAIAPFVRTHRLGEVLGARFDVILRQQDPAVVLQPDVFFVARAHMDRMQESGLYGAPDLLVEVVSPSNARQDSIKKRQLYADHGVQEYWMVLPEVEQVEVLRREGGPGFGRPVVLEAGDCLSTPLLPGFELAVADLFEAEA